MLYPFDEINTRTCVMYLSIYDILVEDLGDDFVFYRVHRRSSLFFNTSARHEGHKCYTSAIRTTRARHECYTNDTSATRVKNVDFDNDTIENILSHPYIKYMANERLQGGEQFHSKNYLSEMPRSHAKMCLKSAPQKLNFAMPLHVPVYT